MSKKRKTGRSDPHAKREAGKYENPVASREYISELLEQAEGPRTHKQLCSILELNNDDNIEALRRRLIAMVRDGQLISDRRGAFGLIDKMDLVKGRVLAHRDGYGFVRPQEGGDDIYLTNRQMKKVFDGDEVLVRKGHENFRGQSEGSIVEVLKRNTNQLVGQLVLEHGYCFLSPDNPKVNQDIVIDPTKTMGAQPGQIVVVEIVQQPGKHQRPQGIVKEILGDHLAPGMEIDVAVRSHGIPHEWPSGVHKEVSKIEPQVNDADKLHRVDLRHLPFVTIDGEDARDFDDAVFCETKASGGWRLFVAIADVSHYVRPGSALDLEAQNRATSVYFPNYVVPMLPEVLSNGLCSLNPLVDRLCMVCEMTISAAGKVSGYKFYEAVMHSKARLTYTQVGQLIAERSRKHSKARQQLGPLVDDLDQLHNLYQCLKETRAVRGAIEFETVETRIEFDQKRKIQQIVPVHRNDAHKLIEECMLAANVCAARFLEAHGIPALYRVHDSPKAEKMELLHQYLGELGLSMPAREKVSPADFQAVLSQIQGRPDAQLIQTVMLRSMNQAVYQSTNLGHFGLAYQAYAHFTSPIRRYPDLLVHRAIRSVIRSKRESTRVTRVDTASPIPLSAIYPYTEAEVDAMGDQCSHAERRADDATRDVVSWLKCEYLQDHVGENFEGVVSAVTGFGLFVELKELYVEGLIHITNLPHDYYQFSAAHHRLMGERTRTSFHLGDQLEVKVVRVNLDERKIDFELVQKKQKRRRSAAKTSAGKSEGKRTEQDKTDAQTPIDKKKQSRKPRKRPAKRSPAKQEESKAASSKKSKKHDKKVSKSAKPKDKPAKKKKKRAKSDKKKA